jgi:hypothetical protein
MKTRGSILVVEIRFHFDRVPALVWIIGLKLIRIAGKLFVPFFFKVIIEVVVEVIVVEVIKRLAGAIQSVVRRSA